MNDKIKYILLAFLICMLCLTSCSSDSESQALNLVELRFDLQNISRASITNNTNFKEQNFKVFGDKKFTASSSPSEVIFNGDEVKYNSSGNVWEYDSTQYWFPNHEYSFVAVHPATVLSESSTPQYANSGLSFTYTLPSDNKNATDILLATHRRECKEGEANSSVGFRFSHILSLLNIVLALDDNLMKDDEFFQFSKLELSGFNTKATFNVAPASLQANSSQTDDRIVEVTNQEGEGKMTIEYSSPIKVINHGGGVSLFNGDDAIIMLPQTFTDTSNAQLVLTYTINNDTQLKQAIASLKGVKWESGKSYTYRFTISRTGSKFDATVITDWDKSNVGNMDAE